MQIDKDSLNQKQVEEWKKQFGHIYRNRICGVDVIWRKLRRKEYVDLMTKDYTKGTAGIFERQERITKAAVLSPEAEEVKEYIECLAGFSTSLADEIMSRSGFDMSETEEL